MSDQAELPVDGDDLPFVAETIAALAPRTGAFTPGQLAALNQPLMRSAVRQRVGGGGKKLNYLEGHFVKRTANEIFGYDGWSYVVNGYTFTGSEVVKNKDGKEGTFVSYLAHVTVTVGGVTRGDVGYGDATDYGSSLRPHENAAKEAVTDALKRCFTSFGDRFGLVLYDKDRAGG